MDRKRELNSGEEERNAKITRNPIKPGLASNRKDANKIHKFCSFFF